MLSLVLFHITYHSCTHFAVCTEIHITSMPKLEIRVNHPCSASVTTSKLQKIHSLLGRTRQSCSWALHHLLLSLKRYSGLKTPAPSSLQVSSEEASYPFLVSGTSLLLVIPIQIFLLSTCSSLPILNFWSNIRKGRELWFFSF